jgi:hypothetical protein
LVARERASVKDRLEKCHKTHILPQNRCFGQANFKGVSLSPSRIFLLENRSFSGQSPCERRLNEYSFEILNNNSMCKTKTPKREVLYKWKEIGETIIASSLKPSSLLPSL